MQAVKRRRSYPATTTNGGTGRRADLSAGGTGPHVMNDSVEKQTMDMVQQMIVQAVPVYVQRSSPRGTHSQARLWEAIQHREVYHPQ